MKIVINACYGGFSLSREAVLWMIAHDDKEAQAELVLCKKKKTKCRGDRISRNNPLLVRAIETLGDKANGDAAQLAIVNIPSDVNWVIEEDDGYEHVAEKHRKWYE